MVIWQKNEPCNKVHSDIQHILMCLNFSHPGSNHRHRRESWGRPQQSRVNQQRHHKQLAAIIECRVYLHWILPLNVISWPDSLSEVSWQNCTCRATDSRIIIKTSNQCKMPRILLFEETNRIFLHNSNGRLKVLFEENILNTLVREKLKTVFAWTSILWSESRTIHQQNFCKCHVDILLTEAMQNAKGNSLWRHQLNLCAWQQRMF